MGSTSSAELAGLGGPGRLAAAVNRAVMWRACPDARTIPEGWVLRHHAAPLVHMLNAVRLRAVPAGGSAEVETLAERWLGDLRHRSVVIEDPAGEALAPALGTYGWRRDRLLLMALDPLRAVFGRDPRGREVDEAALRAAERAIFVEDNVGQGAHPELPAQLAAAMADVRAHTACRRFAAGQRAEDELVAVATLFLHPDVDGARVAQLESIGTRRAHREQRLAAAAVGAALAAAREWCAELVTLVTDADDWPQLWYARLGFRPVGRQTVFHREA